MIKQHVSRTVVVGIVGLLLGLLVALVSPPVYESRLLLTVGSREDDRSQSGLTEDVQKILATGGMSTTTTETDLLRSPLTFYEALTAVGSTRGRADLVDSFQKLYNMYDVQASDKSNAAMVIVRTNDPQLSVDLALAVYDVYTNKRKNSDSQAVGQAKNYLEPQVNDAKKLLDAAQAEYRNYKEKSGVADLEATSIQLTTLRSQTQAKVDDTQAQLNAAEAEVARLKQEQSRLPKYSEASDQMGQNQTLLALESKLNELQNERVQLASTYQDGAPQLKTLDVGIAETKRQIRDLAKNKSVQVAKVKMVDPVYTDVKSKIIGAQAHVDSLVKAMASYKNSLAEIDQKLSALPEKEQGVLARRQDLQSKQQVYSRLSETLQAVENRPGRNPAVRLNDPVANNVPVAPDKTKYMFVGLLAGISLGLVLSFVIEAARLRVYTSHQLSDLTGVPVSGTITQLPTAKAQKVLAGAASEKAEVLESIRYMAFAATAQTDPPLHRVIFSGGGAGVGVTTTASQFAIAVAGTGVKTLLIDANLRRPRVSEIFGAKGKVGLSDVIAQDMLPAVNSDVVLPTNHANLSLLPSGNGNLDSITMASGQILSGFLENLGQQFDMVVIDTPPCDLLSDAARLAPYVDECFLVVSARSANMRNVPSAYEILQRAGAKKTSIVLNHADPSEEAFSKQASYVLGRSA